jgi:hypothetical protein
MKYCKHLKMCHMWNLDQTKVVLEMRCPCPFKEIEQSPESCLEESEQDPLGRGEPI